MPNATPHRCAWANSHPLMAVYHDTEWGVPERDSRALWEKLMLDGFQAGLSWLTILKKRDAFRVAFEGFDPQRIAQYTETDITCLLENPGIVRSHAKIAATIGSARAYLAMQENSEEFSPFVWSFTDGQPLLHPGGPIPASTPLSTQISKALKQRGFKFVGPTITYSWMQAVGIVNDHDPACFRRHI